MIREIADCTPQSLAGFDQIIDVRSPAEFAEDHVPGAVNMPVLTDAQRTEVGTIYVQDSKFRARRVGAAFVSRNIADHLAGPLSEREGAFSPLIYCWRGGQRSAAMAAVLSQVGWRVGLLSGGYRTYRRGVVAALYDSQAPLRVVILGGPTGAGKTQMLALLAERGVQTLDLEALAAHRGSLFGDVAGTAQPGQKAFESALAAALAGIDPARPVVVEAESSRIGELRLPPRLWRAMQTAPVIELDVPVAVRARRTAADYADMRAHPQGVLDLIARLPRHHGREDRVRWAAMVTEDDAEGLASALIEAHYDPAYARSSAAHDRPVAGRVRVEADSPAALAQAADAVVGLLASC
ncbi:tRNA 2-selenouridine(34) synthase MnmH [soil metagenome]